MKCSKVCYPTKKKGKEAYKMLKNLPNFKNLQKGNIYYCEICSHWHLTTMTRKQYEETTKQKKTQKNSRTKQAI